MSTTRLPEVDLRVVVDAVVDEADGVKTFHLSAQDGGPLPDWEPGAHIDVVLPDGSSRQYPLCGSPAQADRYRIGVLRVAGGRGGSRFLHDEVGVGHQLTIRGPRNHFHLDAAPSYVLIAGGIGITPLLPMVAETERRGAQWSMVYGGRSLASMAFQGELDRRVLLVPQDVEGRIDLGAALDAAPEGTLVYCCGPPPLIEAVRQRCGGRPGIEAFRFELFEAPEDSVSTEDDEPFEVVLAHTGTTVRVDPGHSILEKVREAGADVLSDCEDGICGSCETAILEGEADHRDHVLTDEEREANSCSMICVSRSRGRSLVLDL